MPMELQVAGELTVGEAVRNYISALAPADRPTNAPILQQFSRWFGPQRGLYEVDAVQLERYQEQMASSGLDPASRLEPLRTFLSDARAKKLIPVAVANYVKVRRKSAAERLSLGRPVAVQTIDVTRAGFEQLQAELEQLETADLPEAISAMQRAAADKDFRENAPYDAAKQHRAELQRRIEEIKETLSHAIVVDEAGGDRVSVGTRVIVRDLDDDDVNTYLLVGPGERGNGKISTQSPVGQALLDHVVGDVVNVKVPAGLRRYRIENIESSM
ncbi:MAG: GreA/GreB family elongation factor [Chloroflexi bacterium]|nr:GreA/GreB family elongation factor [Chloroflexota bacterium]